MLHSRQPVVPAPLQFRRHQSIVGIDSIVLPACESKQYTSLAFGKRCQEAEVRPSMGSVGDAYDNAMCESFFATLECELLERRRFASQAEALVGGPFPPARSLSQPWPASYREKRRFRGGLCAAGDPR